MLRSLLTASALLAALAGSSFGQAATPVPQPTPVPNTVDLSKFKGRYRGKSKVALDSGALHLGDSKTRIAQTVPNALTIKVDAHVRADGQSISIGNRIDFAADGVVRGQNLAPGVLKNAKFAGLYTATSSHTIEFSGNYHTGKLDGRFSGTANAGRLGSFTFRFAIFPGESAVAAYVYQYSGKTPRTGGK
jgi:hypothetical protein